MVCVPEGLLSAASTAARRVVQLRGWEVSQDAPGKSSVPVTLKVSAREIGVFRNKPAITPRGISQPIKTFLPGLEKSCRTTSLFVRNLIRAGNG
jgi:hypothetical protein